MKNRASFKQMYLAEKNAHLIPPTLSGLCPFLGSYQDPFPYLTTPIIVCSDTPPTCLYCLLTRERFSKLHPAKPGKDSSMLCRCPYSHGSLLCPCPPPPSIPAGNTVAFFIASFTIFKRHLRMLLWQAINIINLLWLFTS